MAFQCYHHYNQAYNGPQQTPNSSLINLISAMTVTPESLIDPNWYPYLGATNHYILDIGNLVTKQEYPNSEKIYMHKWRKLGNF